jgi:hypothetical protein
MFQLKWRKKIAVPGKPLKRKLPGTDEEEKGEKIFTQIIIHTNAARHQIFFQVELKPFRI